MDFPKNKKVQDNEIYKCTEYYCGAWTKINKGEIVTIINSNKRGNLLFIGTNEKTGVDEYEAINEKSIKTHFVNIL